jgi:hypothetical protein
MKRIHSLPEILEGSDDNIIADIAQTESFIA